MYSARWKKHGLVWRCGAKEPDLQASGLTQALRLSPFLWLPEVTHRNDTHTGKRESLLIVPQEKREVTGEHSALGRKVQDRS